MNRDEAQAIADTYGDHSDYVPAEAAAAFLRCSLWKVRSMAQSGELRAAKVGKRYLYDFPDLQRWLDEQMNRPPIRKRRQRAS